MTKPPPFVADNLPVLHRNRWVPEAVRADADGIQVGPRFVPRAEIVDGIVIPGALPRVLVRARSGLRLEVRAGSGEEARALLRAIGLDASRTVATFAVRPQLTRPVYNVPALWGLLLLFTVFLENGGMKPDPPASAVAAGVLLAAAIGALLFLALAPQRLRVGGDGVEVRRPWSRRFLGYDQIASVAPYEKGSWRYRLVGLSVALHSGEELRVPMTGDEDVTSAEQRIDEAMASLRRGSVEADAAVLRRGERGLDAWVAALRAIGAGANADLRTAPVPREKLFRILEDAACTTVDRAAAAVALGSALDDEERARLGAAAEATVAPRLRDAIEEVTRVGSDAALEALLAEIEEEEPGARAS